MDESYFMYHEDTDLSLRCHLAGLRVVYCPDAVALHAYDFSRNAGKMYLLERNRFLTVLADFPTHLLLRVLPVIVLLEPLYLVIALRDGWGREKVRAWGWLLRHTGVVRARRRRVQAAGARRPRPRRAARTGGHPDPARPTEGPHPAQPRPDLLLARRLVPPSGRTDAA